MRWSQVRKSGVLYARMAALTLEVSAQEAGRLTDLYFRLRQRAGVDLGE